MKERDFETKATRTHKVRGPVHPLAVPIYASSTYELESAKHGAALSELQKVDGQSPWLYSRWGNPTTDVTARAITHLENGYASFVTSSGMAAISTALFSALKGGDHIVAPNPVYGGTHELFQKILPQYGVEVTMVDGTSIGEYQEAIKDNTKVLYGETPANPTMSILDLAEFGRVAKENSVLTMVDSTFGSPYNQQPIGQGVDVVLHSATKYLGGHSDIIAGSVTSSTKEFHSRVFQTLKLFGGTLSPFDSFLLSRGIKTLAVRVEKHNQNALQVADFLENHQKIKRVYYPGLSSHPQHEIAKKQMRGFGGMIAFEVNGGAAEGQKVIENLDVITLAVSLGGVESLIEQASTMTHTMVPREERLKSGITDGLIRFSVGLESANDLIDDLTSALDRI
ncbi:MAG: trans-sulfuration enzyme family protein [Candidatus Kariarchaeaceae archaeon]